jgi:hypothetical protein
MDRLSKQGKKEKALIYARLYRVKKYNISNNITEWCYLCKRHVIVDPIKPHSNTHWILEKRNVSITLD